MLADESVAREGEDKVSCLSEGDTSTDVDDDQGIRVMNLRKSRRKNVKSVSVRNRKIRRGDKVLFVGDHVRRTVVAPKWWLIRWANRNVSQGRMAKLCAQKRGPGARSECSRRSCSDRSVQHRGRCGQSRRAYRGCFMAMGSEQDVCRQIDPGGESTLEEAALRRQQLKNVAGVERCMPLEYQIANVDGRATRSEQGWLVGNHRDMPAHGLAQLEDLLEEQSGVFAEKFEDLPGYSGEMGKFKILLDTTDKVRETSRRHSPAEQKAIDGHYGPARDAAFIEKVPEDHPLRAWYGHNTTTATKKDAVSGEWTDVRVCSDARKVNKRTCKDEYQMPVAETLLRKVGGARFFSSLDLKAGFNQILMDEDSKIKTAFHWNGELWQWNRMTFGWRNASAAFQKIMDHELARGCAEGFAVVYVDDILIFSNTWEEHMTHIRRVLTLLKEVGLRCHPAKSLWAGETVHFLGFGVGYYGITPQQAKIKAIRDMGEPENLSELRSQLGLINYYRCFLPHISARLSTVREKLKKNTTYAWGQAEIQELRELKNELCESGLALRHIDPKKELLLHTDWSCHGIAAVLSQKDDDGKEYMIATASRSLTGPESRYSSFHGELLAVVFACRTFHIMLHGPKFKLITDHKALTWLLDTKQHINPMHMRWSLALECYDFEVVHRMGAVHQNADVPSRFPVGGPRDFTGAKLDMSEDSERPSAALAMATLTWTLQQTSVSLCAALYNACPDPTNLGGDYWDDMSRDPSDSLQIFQSTQLWLDRALLNEDSSIRGSVAKTSGSGVRLVEAGSYGSGGLQVVELFGGLGAGLELILRSGVKVVNYIYVENRADIRNVMHNRLKWLCKVYPRQLSVEVCEEAMNQMPNDVRDITSALVQEAVRACSSDWLIVAGFPCQDLSPAGNRMGLNGAASAVYYDMLTVLKLWQASVLQGVKGTQVGYLIENVAWQLWPMNKRLQDAWSIVTNDLGMPVTVDAAKVGAPTHRQRNIWTNLADSTVMQTVVGHATRDEWAIDAQNCLGNDVVTRVSAGRYCREPDVDGEPVKTLPTLMKTKGSRAFVGEGLGVLEKNDGGTRVPTNEERCLLMGYDINSFGVISEQLLHELTGNAMCAFTLMVVYQMARTVRRRVDGAVDISGIFSASEALSISTPCRAAQVAGMRLVKANSDCGVQPIRPWEQTKDVQHFVKGTKFKKGAMSTKGLGFTGKKQSQKCSVTWVKGDVSMVAGEKDDDDVEEEMDESDDERELRQQYEKDASELRETLQATLENEVTEATETINYKRHDVWLDESAMRCIKGEQLPAGKLEKQRVGMYKWDDQWKRLLRVTAEGVLKNVPPPGKRAALIKEMHEHNGHYGALRTYYLLQALYYWVGMRKDVRQFVKGCEVCDRFRAKCNALKPSLTPLPLMGPGYRWNVDLAGPLPITKRGNVYVMVAVDHWSKHMELLSIPNKEAETVAAAFAEHVLCRFGAPAEVVTDGGSEFKGAFEELLTNAFIDHRVTSRGHPQADGMAERCVQTAKAALAKMVEDKGTQKTWDELLPYVAMGYRCSRQKSTGFSPYEMLYAVAPVVPPAIRERMLNEDLDVETPASRQRAAVLLLQRAQLVAQRMVMAGENLAIAQHRDCLRYAQVRTGGYLPKLRQFKEGDYVYVKQVAKNALSPAVQAGVWRIVAERPNNMGTFDLMNSAGEKRVENLINMSPCHLPTGQSSKDVLIVKLRGKAFCAECKHSDFPEKMLVCQVCAKVLHMWCDIPAMQKMPEGMFICGSCKLKGFKATDPADLEEVRNAKSVAENGEAFVPGSSVKAQKFEAESRKLDGIVINKKFNDGKYYLGKVKFVPSEHPPNRFAVTYDDGQEELLSIWDIKKWKEKRPRGRRAGVNWAAEGSEDCHITDSRTEYVYWAQLVHEMAHNGARDVVQFPDRWDKRSSIFRRQLIDAGMGSCSSERGEEILSSFLLKDSRLAVCNLMCDSVLGHLTSVVDVGRIRTIVDPFGWDSAVGMVMQGDGIEVSVNLINGSGMQSWCDAFQPIYYRRVQMLMHTEQIDAIITAPPLGALDFLLPMWIYAAEIMVCALVNIEELMNPSELLGDILNTADRQNRLVKIVEVPTANKHEEYTWVCIFRTAEIKSRALIARDRGIGDSVIWAQGHSYHPYVDLR